MGTIKGRNSKQKRLRRGGKQAQKDCARKGLSDLDSHSSVVALPKPDILECEVKWALGNIIMNRS